MPQSLQLSLCVTLSEGPEAPEGLHKLTAFLQDLTAFFQKFPISYEVLLAIDPRQDQSRTLIESFVQKAFPLKIIPVSKSQQRAKNLGHLLAEGQGEVLITYPLDQALPFAELFKILQNFFSDPDLEVLFTHRSLRKSFEKEVRLRPRSKWEQIFMDILREKNQWPFQDPFAPVLGIRRGALAKIQKDLKPAGTEATPEIQRAARKAALRWLEISVIPSSAEAPRAYSFCQLGRLLGFVLFRVRSH